MSTSQLHDNADAEDRIEFDQLCYLCESLFDAKVTWVEDCYRHHHDIFSLASSAAHGCHLCNLILGQIKPENVKRLQQDLAELATPVSRQMGINIPGKKAFALKIAARGSVLPVTSYQSAAERREGWSVIGKLEILPEEVDYSNAARSKAILNCSETSIAHITDWMSQCIISHEKCLEIQTVAATRDVLPKRLLDISSTAETGRLRLVSTTTLDQHTLYVTLSHCWGGKCGTVLGTDNVGVWEGGVDVSILPRTFQDAVMITTKLSVRYLWIDALCIIQDSPDDTEWRHEASIMGDIYANSYVTLAATTSENSEGGLLHRRNPLSIWPCRIAAKWKCFKLRNLVVSVGKWARERDMKPLEDRAWAFQEWLLAKRLIHFSHDQVRWECYCLAASELYPEGLDEYDIDDQGLPTKRIINLLSDKDSAVDALWERIREEYSAKQLTKAVDKLTAFSGIARMAHKVLKSAPEEYCVGLWKPMLLAELLWKRNDDEVDGCDRPSGVYIAPTWSWASLNGGFWRSRTDTEKGRWLVDVVEIRIHHVGDMFGPVHGGCLVLRCSLCLVTLTVVEKDPKYFLSKFHWELTQINGASVRYRSTADLDYCKPGEAYLGSELCCYFMPMHQDQERSYGPRSDVSGLLLRPNEGSNGQYHRIGLLRVYLNDGDPDIKVPMVQGRDLMTKKQYIDSQEGEFGVIEVV